jgi:hypothetical protein
VAARAAHHFAEHEGEPGLPAPLAPVQLGRPVRTGLLARGAYQDLATPRHGPSPRALRLGRVVGGPAAQPARGALDVELPAHTHQQSIVIATADANARRIQDTFVGGMFAFNRKKLVGSQRSFRAVSRVSRSP